MTIARAVQRRHVFFIAGFDPRSARWYHALYRVQARRRAAVGGLALEVDRERRHPTDFSTAWTIRAASTDGEVRTCYEVLQWDDIVRAHWAQSATRVLVDGVRSVAQCLRDGAARRMYRLSWPPVAATLFPLAVLAAFALLGVATAGGAAAGLRSIGVADPTLRLIAAAAAGVAVFMLGLQVVHRIRITWFLRLVHFTLLHAAGRATGLEQRLDAFAERLAAVAREEPPDEILIVGHSVGATLAISVIARALDRLPQSGDGPAPVLLSLGHCIPLHASQRAAHTLRSELQRVCRSKVDWLDITSPIDWAAFPGVDPVAAAGLAAPAEGWHPRLRSPRFHTLFSAAGYARLRRNRFQVHMQYLMATELPGRYDYFAVTGGAQRLQDRFVDETLEAAASE